VKILLVEDDRQTADYIAKGLREHGHVVDHAPNGRDGLFLAAGERYDVMVVDRMLPGMDGLSLIKTVRATGVKTPVLFLTTMAASRTASPVSRPAATTIWSSLAFAELWHALVRWHDSPPMVATTSLHVGDLDVDLLTRTAPRRPACRSACPGVQDPRISGAARRSDRDPYDAAREGLDFISIPRPTSSRRISAACAQDRQGIRQAAPPYVRGAGYVIERLTRILRSASFRLTLAYAILFIFSAGALFATVYWTANAAMQSVMSAVLRARRCSWPRSTIAGLRGLAEQITRRMNFRTRGPIYYLCRRPIARSWSATCRACRRSTVSSTWRAIPTARPRTVRAS